MRAHASQARSHTAPMPTAHGLRANPAVRAILRAPRIQPKLTIGAVNDPAEREADQVADRVMRMPEPGIAAGEAGAPPLAPGTGGSSPPHVRRKCAACAAGQERGGEPHSSSSVQLSPAETSVQRICAECEGEPRALLQRSAFAGGEPETVPPIVHEVLHAPGQTLDAETRAFMEPRFGHDLSGVRVHTDARAADSARAMNALAFTVTPNIVFGGGQFAPESRAGRRLLAHELAHTVQQDRAGRPRLDRFEAPVHQRVESRALTTSSGAGALTIEEASSVYFGNWMRDMNQVFVPLLTGILPPDVLFAMISYMAARKFGRELTPEQFGYYIPAEHMDNPAGLVAADDLLSSQPAIAATVRPALPTRLGAGRPTRLDMPQESVHPTTGTIAGVNIFAVDETGVMGFIRRSNLHIERRLQLAADAGRTPDGMQHFGAALHAVEDLFAHSNYVEIAVDRLLRTDPTFLQTLTGTQRRRVFTYAPSMDVGPGHGPAQRPVLTTGTFTGADTAISLSSEVVGFLSSPLPTPASNEERDAQERFVVALLRTFDARIRSDPRLQNALDQALAEAGVPSILASHAHQVSLADIYTLSTFIPGIPIPDAIRLPLKQLIRETLSERVLQPIAGEVQAAALEARVSDTSLTRVLRESQRQQSGQFTAPETATMYALARITGETPAARQAATSIAAGRRVQAIQGTPLAVVAGPSHSQIAKDHPNSPFFGLAFLLANVAVQRLRDRMLAAWDERHGAATTPFSFDRSSFPPAAPGSATPADAAVYQEARNLYQVGRGTRVAVGQAAQQEGEAIVTQGGEPGQAHDLAGARARSAQRIRDVAHALQALAGGPGALQSALSQFRTLLSGLVPAIAERLRTQLAQAIAAARAAAGSRLIADLNARAAALLVVATDVEDARLHADRERTNVRLIAERQAALAALASQPGIDTGLAVALLYALDEEIQATAVAYTSEQRAVLEAGGQVPEMGASPRGLTVTPLSLPPVTGSPATVLLLNESRLLVAHPYVNNWWEGHVRSYARQFPVVLINDIEARNEGVPFFRD